MLFTRRSKQVGYGIITDPIKGVEEVDSITCSHCGNTEWPLPGQTWEFLCTCCDSFICRRCVGKGCTPLLKRLDMWEEQRRREILDGKA